jgi:hypothetical protein
MTSQAINQSYTYCESNYISLALWYAKFTHPDRVMLNVSCQGTVNLHATLCPVPDAMYNGGGRRVSSCLQGTRVEIIELLMGWVDGNDDRPICWLNGPAGFGKSSIARTIAERCAGEQKLAASFFFLRGAGDRSNIARFIRTLAYHISVSIPATQPFLEDVLRHDPLVLNQALEDQFQKLLLAPISALTEPVPSMTIIVDALDECDDGELAASFVEIVILAASVRQLPFQFLFTSRIEEHIRAKFESRIASPVVFTLSLKDFDASDDIRTYYGSRFLRVYEDNLPVMRSVPWPWPSYSDLDKLIEMTSGSFIFANTVVNFVNDGSMPPNEKLAEALHGRVGLDALYSQILSPTHGNSRIERVIGTVMVLQELLSVVHLASLLHLDKAAVRHALMKIQSILVIPASDEEDIQLVHTSLRDFLVSKERSQKFYIDPPAQHFSITIDCLRVMAASSSEFFLDGYGELYSSSNWCYHFNKGLQERGSDSILDWQLLMKCLTEFAFQSFALWVNTTLHYDRRELHEQLKDITTQLKVSLKVYMIIDQMLSFTVCH